MSTNDRNEWVQEGTPRDEWDADTDYGVEIDPTEWDDYSDEQAVHVPTPAAARDYQPPVEDEPAAEEPAAEEQPAEAPVAEEPVAHEQPAEEQPVGEPVAEEQPAEEQPVEEPVAQEQPADAGEDEPWEETHEAPTQAESFDEVAADEDAYVPAEQEDAAYDEAALEETQIRQRPFVPFTGPGTETVPADEPAEATAEDADATAEFAAFPEATDAGGGDDTPADEAEASSDQDAGTGLAAPGGAAAAGTAGFASLYRGDAGAEAETQVIEQSRLAEEQAAEEARLARLQEQRDARDARLGIVPGSDENNVRVVEKPTKRQADRFLGAFSLFVLRLVTAAIIGVLGYQVLQDIDAAAEFLAGTIIPEPRTVAWVLGFGLVAMAVLLVIGLGARVVGFVLLAVAIASLVLIRWGAFSVFLEGMEGFLGDRTLLTAAVALILVAFGAGRWSVDGAIHLARENSRAARSQ